MYLPAIQIQSESKEEDGLIKHQPAALKDTASFDLSLYNPYVKVMCTPGIDFNVYQRYPIRLHQNNQIQILANSIYNSNPSIRMTLCSRGFTAVMFCKYLQCTNNIFMCANSLCECRNYHSNCSQSLRVKVEEMLESIQMYKEAIGSFNIPAYLDEVVLNYETLEKRILNDKLQAAQLCRLLKKRSQMVEKLEGTLSKSSKSDISTEMVGYVENCIGLTLGSVETLRQASLVVPGLITEINKQMDSLRGAWQLFNQLHNIESEENHRHSLKIRQRFKFDDSRIRKEHYSKVCCNVDEKYNDVFHKAMKEWKETQRVRLVRENLKEVLRENQRLSSLDLSSDDTHDQHLSVVFENERGLKRLIISYNKITTQGIVEICQKYPQLRELNCQENSYNPRVQSDDDCEDYLGDDHCMSIDDQAMKALASLQYLEKLIISKNRITAVGLQYFAKGRRENLLQLQVSQSQLGEQGAAEIGMNFQNLKKLGVSQCSIGDTGLAMIAKGIRQLEVLEIEGNLITDEGVITLANHQKSLKVLIMHNDKYEARRNTISDRGLMEVCLNMSALQHFNFDVGQITRHGIIYLSKLKHIRALSKFRLHEPGFDMIVKLLRNARYCSGIAERIGGNAHRGQKKVHERRFNNRNYWLISAVNWDHKYRVS